MADKKHKIKFVKDCQNSVKIIYGSVTLTLASDKDRFDANETMFIQVIEGALKKEFNGRR